MSASTAAPLPAPGSHRYFAWLYTPRAHREELCTLLALADEIGADPAPSADHSIAHVRLEWWRREAERFTQRTPQHPWLRALLAQRPQAAALNLQRLVEAAAIDLATRTLSGCCGEALRRALFELAATALCGQPLPAPVGGAIGELGASVHRLERDPADRPTRAQLSQQLRDLGAAPQAPLAPLLVWLALAAGPRRRGRLLIFWSDNLLAWNSARRAVRGRFRLDG
jgi:hypothetical protein